MIASYIQMYATKNKCKDIIGGNRKMMQYRLPCACHRIVPLVINGKHPHKLISEPFYGDHGPKSIAGL